MAIENRIRSLEERHFTLDQAIVKECARTLPDEIKVSEWKREKLRIKDTIAALSR